MNPGNKILHVYIKRIPVQKALPVLIYWHELLLHKAQYDFHENLV